MSVEVKKLFEYWMNEAAYSWDVAESLLENKKYPEALFFGHLALEKLLKALVVAETREHAPPIHDLVKLGKKSSLALASEQVDALGTFSSFYMAGRYDEEKMQFRKKCTHEYTQKYFIQMKEYYLWLKGEAKKISLIL